MPTSSPSGSPLAPALPPATAVQVRVAALLASLLGDHRSHRDDDRQGSHRKAAGDEHDHPRGPLV